MNRVSLTVNRYTMTLLVSLSIWIFANIIHLVLAALSILVMDTSSDFLEGPGFIILFSSIYSLPGMVVFWLLLLLNCRSEKVSTILLITACITSFSPLLLLLLTPDVKIGASVHLFLMALISAVTSVILHRRAVANVFTAQQTIVITKRQ